MNLFFALAWFIITAAALVALWLVLKDPTITVVSNGAFRKPTNSFPTGPKP
jgi:hypothetical protein